MALPLVHAARHNDVKPLLGRELMILTHDDDDDDVCMYVKFLPTMSIHGHSRALGSATRTRDLHSPQVSHTATTIPDQVNDDRPFEGVSFKPVYLGVII